MYKNFVTIIVMILVLIGGPVLANAQGVQDDTYYQAPVNNTSSETTGTTASDQGANWLWLLPLLALPLIILLFQQGNRAESRSREKRYAFVGTKGGKASKKRTKK